MMFKKLVVIATVILLSVPLFAQQSVARVWNDILLESIREDFARPTIHARNLFHVSAAMYDAWSIYDNNATTYFTGKMLNNTMCPIEAIENPTDIIEARKTTISYAAYRLLNHRFKNSPNKTETIERFNSTFQNLGHEEDFISIDYLNDGPAALGNYIAKCYIEYGLQDGANEELTYANSFYAPVNDPLEPAKDGNPNITNPDRWQPLKLDVRIDQSGNLLSENVTEALSPEWGNVLPFSLTTDDLTIYNKDGNQYKVFYDPDKPPYYNNDVENNFYKWGFEMVTVWSCHLSPSDNVVWDISPASKGNVQHYPTDLEEYADFYNYENGGDSGTGYEINPITNLPYEPNMVKRGDFARVLAEFWADGPDSETPPGHWFTVLNYVNDHPLHINKFNGIGEEINQLEWDIKTYFMMGAAMHDVAISAWGIKGYYDYIRPVSAIRYLADLGQCSNSDLPNYNIGGIDLKPEYIALVDENDPLVGENLEHLNKVKLYCWRGPDYIFDEDFSEAGVGWILAENWWPYQRPSFVTPPFSGYISGHSTFSAAAAELLELITGTPYFPGGLGEFEAKKDEFLVFEDGPSETFKLQWATYKDAADQSALSRIWGGIHPPCDDIPGRKIGEQIGKQAFELANKYFRNEAETQDAVFYADLKLFPNPSSLMLNYSIPPSFVGRDFTLNIYDAQGKIIKSEDKNLILNVSAINISDLNKGIYILKLSSAFASYAKQFVVE